MRLKSLYIKEYKNIKDQTFDFSEANGLALFIGNNGSGKSNVLEAISDIFSNLYLEQTNFKTKEFQIEYTESSGTLYSVKYDSNGLEKRINDREESATNRFVLPKRIIAVYSGETERLWKLFYKPIYDQFIQQINTLASYDLPRMFYLNHFYWNIALLSLLCSEADDVKDFCRNEIGVKDNIRFEFKYALQKGKTGYHNYTGNRVLSFVKSFDSKTAYTIDDYIQSLEQAGFERNEFFELLYCAYTPKDGKIITDVTVKFNNNISVDDLSEGLKKRILIRAALEFAGQENSLYILDEPDAHVHLSKKKKIIEDLELYRRVKQFVISSHSPTMCKHVGKKEPHSIFLLVDGKKEAVSDLFEAGKKLSDDDEVFNLLFTTKNLVITEGKTDCKYITKAIELYKDLYPTLNNSTDFMSVGGTDGDVVNELLPRITDIPNRKIIILVDRDDGGLKCAKKILNKNNLKKDDIDVLDIPNKQNAKLIMIPSKHKNGEDFVIEDYFNHQKIRKLSTRHIVRSFKGKNFKQFPKVKDDLKSKLLPNFCEESSNPKDFTGFKRLLTKLERNLLT